MFFQSSIFIIFSVYFFHKTALHIAVENNNIEILKLLLQHLTIDVNSERIFNNNFFFKVCNNFYFNYIPKHLFLIIFEQIIFIHRVA